MHRKAALTPDEEVALDDYRQRYLAYGLSTAPADRDRAEAAFARAYRRIGREPVPTMWVGSPLTANLLYRVLYVLGDKKNKLEDSLRVSLADSLRASLAASLWGSLRDSLRASLEANLGGSLAASLWDSLWASLEASLGGSLRDSLWGSLRDSLRASLEASLGDGLRDNLGDSLAASLWGSLRANLGASLEANLGGSLAASLWDSLWVSLRANLRAGLRDSLADRTAVPVLMGSLWGQMDLYWVAFYQYCGTILGVAYPPAAQDGLAIMDEIGQSCGWWCPFERMVIACDRPAIVQMEASPSRPGTYRLHATDGPAVQFRDGWRIYAWRGVRVPEKLIRTPSQITREDILHEHNAEARRAMMERLGPDRYAQLLELLEVHTDPDGVGTLLRTREPDAVAGDHLQFVRVTCPSTGRVYHLSVPPTVRTAREAVAWTFGHTAATYAPTLER